MTIANLSTQDIQVRDDVMSELEWDPQVDASAIGVAAADGAVTPSALARSGPVLLTRNDPLVEQDSESGELFKVPPSLSLWLARCSPRR